MSEPTEQQSKGFAFSFTKKVKQNNISLNNKLNTDVTGSDGNETKDFVLSIDENHIQSTVQKEEKKELIIPLIVNNRYDFSAKRDSVKNSKNQSISDSIEKETKSDESLEELAKRELLREANEWNDEPIRGEVQSSRVIPAMDSLISNRVPEGFESENNFDVSLRPIEPTIADYQSVPVEEFGLALLKGMGWKPGMPVGANTKEVYIPSEPQIRPKGLGLGAERSMQKQMPKSSENLKEEDLQPKKGSFICIEFGAHKGSYGVIEDFDDDMSRVTVKLVVKKESIKTPVALVRVVTKKEFENDGKVINKAKYEEYKQMEEKGHQSHRNDSSNSRDKEKSRSDSKSNHENKSEDKNKRHSSHKTWLLPNLKVRIIDKNYKNGKYYKEKVVVIDVLSANKCCCKTSNERLLEDIDHRMLETVIPKENDINVMVLEGKYRKELGFIVDRNRSRNEAKVQLLADKRKIITLNYDHICEYVNHF